MSALVTRAPELVIPFHGAPQFYATRIVGDCCAPEIPDGSKAVFDQKAEVRAGDFVIVWYLARETGTIKAAIKQLVIDLAPWTRFPHVDRPGENIRPALILATLNPPKKFSVDTRTVYGVHKCVGVTTGNMVDHPAGAFRIVADKPKRQRKPRVVKGGAA